MNTIDIIKKKKKNKKLTYNELSYFFNGYLKDNISDKTMTLLLKAMCLKGLTDEEIINLTDIFIKSGSTLNLKTLRGTIDKHSTGGVGDKTTLILGPIIACCGLKMPKMSGRGLGYTGGTIDKLESIGINVDLKEKDFINEINDIGFAISSQTSNLCPMDKKVYALRDVTGTTESIGLIASSIMSKKIASGADKILIDLKVGKGALIKTIKDARKLAAIMIKIGNNYHREVRCVLTKMDTPIGNNIGNSIEILEVIDFLNNKVHNNLYDLIISLATEMLLMMKDTNIKSAQREIINSIESKDAYQRFLDFVKYQGGNTKIKLPKGKEIYSLKKGYIKEINALEVGKLAMKLGAGRENKDDVIDYNAGIILNKQVGDYAKEKDLLCTIYGKKVKVESNKIFKFSKTKPKKDEIIIDIIR